MTVLVAGHLCVDLTPRLGADAPTEPGRLYAVGAMEVQLGGSVANTGRALRALGVPVRAVADVGDDALGTLTRELLASDGIGTSEVRAVAGASSSYSIVLEPTGADRTFWHHSGANDGFTGARLDLGDAAVLHLGYPPLMAALRADRGAAIVELFTRARASGVATSLDLAVVDPSSEAASVDWHALLDAVLPLTDVLTPSRDDLLSIWGGSADAEALAERCLAAGAAIVAITDGAAGIRLAVADAARLSRAGAAVAALGPEWAGTRLSQPALPLDRVATTNGAGDAATAGLLAGILDGRTPSDALALAARSAADAVSGRHARDAQEAP